MNHLHALFLMLLFSVSRPALAADPAVLAHWYQIVVTVGDQKETFTGSSRFDATELGARIMSADAPITLENLRDSGFFADTKKLEWRPMSAITSIHIIPRSIVYFAKLAADPLLPQNAATPPEAK